MMNLDPDVITPKFERDICYAFFEVIDGRLVTPMSDPMVYEFPFDYRFDDASDALEFLYDWIDDNPEELESVCEWVLVEQTRKVQRGVDIRAWIS